MARLQVTGGELRGRRLHAPSVGVRPTTARAREALFSILGEIAGARVLDLFCGSGAWGIEALSRGAEAATLVDEDTRAARRNVADLGLEGRAAVVRADAVRFVAEADAGAYDVVFCDPPYDIASRVAAQLDPVLGRALAPGGVAVMESSAAEPMRLSLPLRTQRSYGDTLIAVHERGDGDRMRGVTRPESEDE